ncbi:MAG: MopE-related protein [Myxococcota bacterium]
MRVGPSLLLFLGLGACSWVGKSDFEERLLEVDDDGDGFPAAEDCNDLDATISPGVNETWYDGIDQACDGGDDYDQDLDGYVALEHSGKTTEGVDGTGALPAGDCDDAAPRVSPKQPDTWYDGVDQDCDGADDFDQDGDGFVPDMYAGEATLYVTGSGTLPARDCDDTRDDINPEQADAWYDGVDTDCGGEDDYDKDGDGFVNQDLYEVYGPTQYADGTGLLPNGDCNDELDYFNPTAPDAWYDELDADCAGDDDFDQDLDGFADPRGGGVDCDDEDAAVNPDAVETLADLVDSDCDGGVNSFSLDPFDGFTWAGPRAPIFAETSERIYLSIVASEVDTGSTHYYDSAVALLWLNDDPTDGRDGVSAWDSRTSDPSDHAVGAGQGFLATEDYLYGATGLDYGDDRALRLTRYNIASGSKTAALANATDGLAAYDDIAVFLDDGGALHVAACDDVTEVLQYVRVPAGFSGGFSASVEVSDVGAADCGLSVRDGVGAIYTSERGGVWEYTFDPTSEDPVFSTVEHTAAYAPLDLDIPASWAERVLVIADATTDSVVLLDAEGATVIAEGETPTEVDVFEDAAGTLYVAYLTAGGDAHLAWGTPDTGYTMVDLDAPFAASDIAVWVSGGHLLYAVTGTSDVAVGIAYL